MHGLSPTTLIIGQLLLVFFIAKIVGEIFHRIKQPVVIGEIAVGVLLGPYVLNWIQLNNPDFALTFNVVAEGAVIIHPGPF